jgi:hypothetical protein
MSGPTVPRGGVMERPAKVSTERLYGTTDASVWAEEFAKVCPDVDEGFMIGWFANAMQTAESHAIHADPDRAIRHDQDFLVLPRDSFLEFMGQVALPPYGPDNDLGGDLDCSVIAGQITDWLDRHDLSDLYFGPGNIGSQEPR